LNFLETMIRITKFSIFTILICIFILHISFGFGPESSGEKPEKSSQIVLTITGIRGTEGHIGIGAFTSSEGFDDEVTDKFFKFSKSNVIKGNLVVSFEIEPDLYGFSLLDDENGNYQMDYNLFGIPKEGFGFSNYYHEGFSKPKFDKFKMNLKPNSIEEISIKIRYLY
jgi:uncharacterized protein (DUF2141 family)